METTTENNAPANWFLGGGEAKKGPFSAEIIKKGITEGKIAPTMLAAVEDTDDWKPVNEIPEFLEACLMAPTAPRATVDYKDKAQKILEEFRQTDFKNELLPIDESNLNKILRDPVFWIVTTLGILPLLIVTLNDIDMQLTGLLFFFALIWGGVFRGFVLKSSEKFTLPVIAFFFTGIIGMWLLAFSWNFHPKFYLEMPDHPNKFMALLGSILHTGITEELCKILPVAIYLLYKRRNASPYMALLIGVFSGLGFAAFENIGYSNLAIRRTVVLGAHGVDMAGADGFIEGVSAGTKGAMINVILRSLSCVFGHAIWTGIFSYFLIMANTAGKRWVVLGFLGLAVPAIIHGTYNWLQGVQPVFAAIVMGAGFVLFYGYLSKMRLHLDQQTFENAAEEKTATQEG